MSNQINVPQETMEGIVDDFKKGYTYTRLSGKYLLSESLIRGRLHKAKIFRKDYKIKPECVSSFRERMGCRLKLL